MSVAMELENPCQNPCSPDKGAQRYLPMSTASQTATGTFIVGEKAQSSEFVEITLKSFGHFHGVSSAWCDIQ